jgi:hypothetical protein
MCCIHNNFVTKANLYVPSQKLGIYIGFQCLSIIKYLEPLIDDLFIAEFADCIFNEDHFLALGGIINLSMMIGKLIGMIKPSYHLIHI